MPTHKNPADEPAERAVGDVVDLARIDREIREQREALAAQRREIEELREGRLSAQSIEVLLDDLYNILANTTQLVGLERQQRDKQRVIIDALEANADELRALRALLEARRARERWRALIRHREAPPPSPPLADLRFTRDAPPPSNETPDAGEASGEG